MEFPSIGGHCEQEHCQTLSFLPFQCSFCGKTYCSTHRLPDSHHCAQWAAGSNHVQTCPRCERLVLTPKHQDPAVYLKEHLDRACSLHLLPAVQSIAVLCAKAQCGRRDRVVQICPDCGQSFCLGHRHGSDHDCSKIQERKLGMVAMEKEKQALKDEIREKFVASAGTPSSSLHRTVAEKEALAREKAEKAKAALEEAKAKVAARSVSKGEAITATGTGTGSSSKGTYAPPATKPKKASRLVAVMKLKKIAQGEDKIPVSSRIYVQIRSPVFPQLDDKAIFVDKTWTVGRALDKAVEWLKIAVPKNEPFDVQKRFSIFHAKDTDEASPTLLNMQDRLQLVPLVESGDVFFLAPADWAWSSSK